MKRKRKSGQEGLQEGLKGSHGGATGRKVPKRRPGMTLQRGSSLLALYARGTLDERQMKAALEFREKVRVMTGGMPAMNWMREKVDGGRLFVGPSGGLTGAMDAERQVKEALAGSGMGLTAAEVVWRVCGLDEAIKLVALDFEEIGPKEEREAFAARVAEARQRMEASQQAQRYVSRVLKDGLARLADKWLGQARRRTGLAEMMSDWLTVHRAK